MRREDRDRLVTEIAETIYEALSKTNPKGLSCGSPAPHEATLIEGRLLRAIARRVLWLLEPALIEGPISLLGKRDQKAKNILILVLDLFQRR
jgi:hypothetical protein